MLKAVPFNVDMLSFFMVLSILPLVVSLERKKYHSPCENIAECDYAETILNCINAKCDCNKQIPSNLPGVYYEMEWSSTKGKCVSAAGSPCPLTRAGHGADKMECASGLRCVEYTKKRNTNQSQPQLSANTEGQEEHSQPDTAKLIGVCNAGGATGSIQVVSDNVVWVSLLILIGYFALS